jgi:glycopeptide antibiotics resistance protein
MLQKIFDYWSIAHFLGGIIIFSLIFLSRIKIPVFFYAFLSLTIIWEIFEASIGVKETILNHIFDIIIGNLGFLIAWSFTKIFRKNLKKTRLFITRKFVFPRRP